MKPEDLFIDWQAIEYQAWKHQVDAVNRANKMTLLLPDTEALLEPAAAYVAQHASPSAIELQQHFQIAWEKAENLANVLQERNLWPKCDARQGFKRTCLLFKGHIRGHVFGI